MRRWGLLLALCMGAVSGFGSIYQPYNYAPSPRGDLYIDLDLGMYSLDMPGFAFGELLSPLPFSAGIAPIPELAFRHERVKAFYPKLAIGVDFYNGWSPCWAGSNLFFEVGVFYVTQDRINELGDGVFGNFALPQLSGGGDFIASAGGLLSAFSGVDLRREYRYGGGQIKLGSDLLFDTTYRFSFTPFFEVDIDTLQQIYKINIGSIVGAVNFNRFFLNESLSTNYYDFGIGVDTSYRFCDCQSVLFFAEGVFFISAAHTRFHGRETAINTGTLLTTTSTIHRQHDALDVKARGQVGIGYQFGYNFAVSVIGQLDYWGYVPAIKNPHRVGITGLGTGIYDFPARIVSKSATNYGIMLNFLVTFF